MNQESSLSVSNLSPRSVPYDHASLDSLLQSSSRRYQQYMNSIDHPGSAIESSRSSFLVSNDVQDYFVKSIGFRQCRTSSVGPTHTLSVDQRLPVVHTDGQDSGVEDLGVVSPGSPRGLDMSTRTNLPQKEFMVYRRALLCAQFPVLSVPQQTSSPHQQSPSASNYPFTGTNFAYLTSRNPQARLTPDKVSLAGEDGTDGRSDVESEEEVLVQNEMLSGLVRRAFQLSEERHRYYDEVITEGLGRKAPARILVEELVSRLSVVENNRHPYYHPQAFEPRAYDSWQQLERRHIGELIESFWQFALPFPASSMVRPVYWQSVHDEYRDLMVRLISLDKRNGLGSYSTSILTSTSRRLLKEFGLRYGVGELYRRIVYLENMADSNNFESQVWYIEMILKELNQLSSMLHFSLHQAQFIMVRHEFELLQKVLSKLHEHSKHGLQGLLQDKEDSSHKAVALVSLLSSVLNMKTQLTGRKGLTLDNFLEGYIKESAKQAYQRHKLRLEMELNVNTYIVPVTAELVAKVVSCVLEDVKRCHEYYQSVFSRYKQNIVKLIATTFYSSLMADVNLVCEMTDISKDLHRIDQDLLALAHKLNDLDTIWRDYIPPPAQQWRQPMLAQAKAWLKIMTNQLTHVVVRTVDTDEFKSDFSEDPSRSRERTSPSPQQSTMPSRASILRHSPSSAFKPVSSSVEGSPARVGGQKATSSQAGVKPSQGISTETSSSSCAPGTKSSKHTKDLSSIKTTVAANGTNQKGGALYFSGSSDIKRIKSLPEITSPEAEVPVTGLRRNVISSDLRHSDTSSSTEIRIQDVGSGVVSFTTTVHREQESQETDTSLPLADSQVSHEVTRLQEVGLMTEDDNILRSEQIVVGSSSPQSDIPQEIDDSIILNNSNVVIKETIQSKDRLVLEDNNNSTEESKESDSLYRVSTKILETDSNVVSDSAQARMSSPDVLTADNLAIVLGKSVTTAPPTKDSDGILQSSEKSGQTTPMPSSNTSSSVRSSSMTSSSSVSPTLKPPSSGAEQSRASRASVSFQSSEVGSSEAPSGRPDRFSKSLVDVMFVSQRIIGFMQRLIEILCPADIGVPLGPDGDFTASLSIRTFGERMRAIKMELKDVTEKAIIKLLCLYANNILAMDLCAIDKDNVNTLVDSQVLSGVLTSRQESMLSRCRHERESNVPCDYYMNRDTALLCDKHEPITQQMCVRINNIWSILCLLPELSRILQSRLRGRPLSPSPSMDDTEQHSGIYDAPIEQTDMNASSLAEGDHQVYLSNILQAQIHMLAHKLNLVLQQALHVLLTPDFDDLPLVDRLQPLTTCLFDHWEALGRWLTPPCLAQFMENLWLRLVEDFEVEVEGLKMLRERADDQASLLSQSIAHLIEFLHAKGEGLSIDQIVKPAEVVLNMLQMHSLSSKNLVHLYQKALLREVETDPEMEPLPTEILEAMYQALHKQRKCFTGHHMVMWLLVHYYKAQEKPTSKRSKYKRKAKSIGQKLLDMNFIQHVSSRSRAAQDILHDDIGDISSDASPTENVPYPPVTIHSVPTTSILRRDLSNDSSEDNLDLSEVLQRRRRTKRRISDFYSEEMESDDSSTSKSEEVVRNTMTLKVDVHVSAAADSGEDASRPKQQETTSVIQKGHLESSSSSDEQSVVPTVVTESSRKAPSSGGALPTSSSNSSSTSSRPGKTVRVSESKHLFIPDSNHFYYFCDIDDQLFHSVSGELTRSSRSGEDKGPTNSVGKLDKHRPHLKCRLVRAEFILGILLCRRKRSRVARDFTNSVPSEFWKEECRSPCCNCFT